MAARGGKEKALEPGFVQRVASGVKYIISGQGAAWMGPGEPLKPMANAPQDQAVGRRFDYPVGYNLMASAPRSGEPISFAEMRALADGYDLLRLVIETRKDQVAALDWTVRPRDSKAPIDERSKAIAAFLSRPDREHSWDEWLRMIVEDMLVIDAACLYPRLNRGGGLYALEPVDGATIKRVLDATGRTPQSPDPAYQQVLKGLPAVDYTSDQLIYRPRNLRSFKVYGFSPVEQIIMTVNIGLRRQLSQLSYYTEGNVPDMIFGVPPEWSADQISQFQMWWDSLNQGQTKHKGLFIPAGVNPINTREVNLQDQFDEWLARVVCFAFSISPTAFSQAVNRATAETAQQQALDEGLAPLQRWVKNLMDDVIARYFGAPDLEFGWAEDGELSPMTRAQVAQVYVAAGILTANEVRADMGRDPLPVTGAKL
jgi:hypothetical protein